MHAREISDVTYCISHTPEGDNYLKIVTKKEGGEKRYSFVLFGLQKDGSIELRDRLVDEPATVAHELIEAVQTEFEEIAREEFEKAETEHSNRESELSAPWKESQRKYYGINIVAKEEKDIMERVSRFPKKPRET